MTYLEIIREVSKETGIPSDIVDKCYKAYWKTIREHIERLNLKEDLSEEDFLKQKTNINIPSLGKLSCTYERYRTIRERYKRIKKLQEHGNGKETD